MEKRGGVKPAPVAQKPNVKPPSQSKKKVDKPSGTLRRAAVAWAVLGLDRGQGAVAVDLGVELAQGFGLDLADTLTGETDVLADFFECQRFVAVKPVTETQDRRFAVVDGVEQ